MGNYTQATRKLSSKIATAQLRFTLGLWFIAKQQLSLCTKKSLQIQRESSAAFGYHFSYTCRDHNPIKPNKGEKIRQCLNNKKVVDTQCLTRQGTIASHLKKQTGI